MRAAAVGPAAVERPLIVEGADAVAWSSSADLVVVGFGGAGVVAAIDAAERGARVIAIDRFAGGGATALSGGIVYAGGTRHQAQEGYQDSGANMYRYLLRERVPVQSTTLERFCTESAANLAWLEAQGVMFGGPVYNGKATYPPEGKFLYFCGNEKLAANAAVSSPAPRGHRVRGRGFTGKHYYAALRKAALDKGVTLMAHAPVRRLVIDKSGAVLGVEVDRIAPVHWHDHLRLYRKVNPILPLNGRRAEHAIARCQAFECEASSGRELIRAHAGIVLCTGGFIYNLARLRQHRPDLATVYPALMRMGSMGCDGSGIALGESAGGNTDLLDNAFVGRSLSPPEPFLRGILVNREGRRFINEDAYIGNVGDAIIRQSGDGTAWLVLDARSFWQGVRGTFTLGVSMFAYWGLPALINIVLGGTRRAPTLATLAEKCAIDGQVLAATLADYNAALRGAGDALGKQAEHCAEIGPGPYYAINVSSHNRFGATSAFTLGGLAVDENSGAVLRSDGSAVPGLYAAGRTALGLCSNGYLSGLSLADTVFSGRRAAMAALAQAHREPKNKNQS
ncbi:MAG: FAD-binding protein [Porticoccaceae bacterium]